MTKTVFSKYAIYKKTLEPIIMQKNIEIGVELIVLWQPVHYILTDLLCVLVVVKRTTAHVLLRKGAVDLVDM